MTTARVGFTIGPIMADPIRDLVYVVDQTADRVVVIDTDTGSTSASIPLQVAAGGLAISPAGDRLYVSQPTIDTIQVIALPTFELITTLKTTVAVQNLVATAGGKLFANVGTDQWCPVDEIDADTGQVLQQVGSQYSFYEPLLRTSPDGTMLYEADTGLETANSKINVFDVSNGIPELEPAIVTSDDSIDDFAISTTTDQAFTNTGGVYGLGTSNAATSVANSTLSNAFGSSVALMPSSNSVFIGGGFDGEIPLDEYDQSTGAQLNQYEVYSVRSASLVITPNSHLVFAEDNTQPAIGNVLGIIGSSSLVVSTAPPAAGAITGTVYNDANGNHAMDDGETGLAGALLYVERYSDQVFSVNLGNAFSDNNGTFAITGVPTGPVYLFEVPPEGYVADGDAAIYGPLPLVVTSGGVIPLDFGNFEPIVVRGLAFDDTNANNKVDQGETGLQNETVFDDLNGDGILEDGEPSTSSDYQGAYQLDIPPAAGSDIRLQIKTDPGYETESQGLIFPSSLVAPTTFNWGLTQGNYVSGLIAEAAAPYASGAYTPLGGITVYADLNNNGNCDPGEPNDVSNADGTYSFGNIPSGQPPVRVVVPAGYSLVSPATAPANTALPDTKINFTLSTTLSLGAIFGQAYTDANGDGTHNPTDPPAVGVTMYIDANSDGQDDVGDPSTITDSAGDWDFINLPAGTYVVQQAIGSNEFQTSPTSLQQQTFIVGNSGPSATVQGVQFGSAQNIGAISGTVFYDANGDGIEDQGDYGEVFNTVYLDENNNGILDDGEPVASADYSGDFSFTGLAVGTYTVREIPPQGQYTSTPAGTANQFSVNLGATTTSISTLLFGNAPVPLVSGRYYDDSNGNGIADAGETGLAGAQLEVSVTTAGNNPTTTTTYLQTDATGYYQLAGIINGQRVSIAPVPPPGDVVTGSGSYSLTAPNGYVASTTTENFFASGDAIIRGSVFAVTSPGPGYPRNGLQGVTVFADLNDNGLLDPDEPSSITDVTGAFQLGVAQSGQVTVQEVLPSGYRPTQPGGNAQVLSVRAGSVASYVQFAVTDAVVSPLVSKTQLNGNSGLLIGAQRSMVDNVEYTFNEPVVLSTSSAFTIMLHTGDSGTLPTLTWSAVTPDANGYSFFWIVSFSGSGVVGHSIADGVYDLTLNIGAATAAGSAGAAGLTNSEGSTTTFTRLFGDITGDDKVNLADFGQLSRSFGSNANSSNYQAALDFNDDGVINLADYGQFKLRFGKSFTF